MYLKTGFIKIVKPVIIPKYLFRLKAGFFGLDLGAIGLAKVAEILGKKVKSTIETMGDKEKEKYRSPLTKMSKEGITWFALLLVLITFLSGGGKKVLEPLKPIIGIIFPERKRTMIEWARDNTQKSVEFLLSNPQWVLLLYFIYTNRKRIFTLLTSSSERTIVYERAFEIIKEQQKTIVKNGKDTIAAANEWANRFYKTTNAYTERDLNSLNIKDATIQELRTVLTVKQDIIHQLELNRYSNKHILELCDANVQQQNQVNQKLESENTQFKHVYRAITEAHPEVVAEIKVNLIEYKAAELPKVDVKTPSYKSESINIVEMEKTYAEKYSPKK